MFVVFIIICSLVATHLRKLVNTYTAHAQDVLHTWVTTKQVINKNKTK